MFSVIIPVYNKAFCISTTLGSVLAQTFTDFEIILVDDGSKDDSVAVIQQFTDSRIRLIQQTNAGVSIARNTGIAAAKGKWIAFLDADDWWHPDFLLHVHQLSERNLAANIIASQFYCLVDSDNWQPQPWSIRTPIMTETIDNLPSRWMKGIPFFTSSVCVQKTTLLSLETCFVPKQNNGEDLDLWFRLAENNIIYLLTQPLVAYRTEQSDSLSQQHPSLLPAFHIQQMKLRLRSQQVPTHLISSTEAFIAQDALTRARQALVLDRRLLGIKLWWSASTSLYNHKRFWMTIFMLLVFPKYFVQQWQIKHSGRQEQQ
jgi:hypothetical protein